MNDELISSVENKIANEDENEDECVCEPLPPLNYYDENYMKDIVLVNIHIVGKYAFTHRYAFETNIAQIKYDLSNKLQTPEEHLQVMHWHVFLNDCTTLEYIPTECRGFLDLTVVNTQTEIPIGWDDMVVPDIITVHIELEDIYKEITVEIEDRSIRKPYIGGYRHKKTGIEYHHAFSQTGPPPPKVWPRNKNTRHTQTVDIRHRRIEMSYSRATQMSNEHIWIQTQHDKIIKSGKYETAAEYEIRRGFLKKVITIQRYFRRWKLKKALKALREEYRRRIENEEMENRELLRDYEKQRKHEIINKVFPRTRSDFAMLYAMVDRWKKAHIIRISKMYSPAAKLAEFYLLLTKEIEMLNVIEKHRQRVKQEMKIVHEIRFFDYISRPIRWIGYKGTRVSMDTLETQKGRTFKEIYYTACNHDVPTNERLEFLTEFIAKLKQHNCTLGNEIISLMEREIELLQHGIDHSKLDMLHKRIQALLLKHYKMPECNENVTKRMVKLKEADMENNLIFCSRCQTLKSHKDYPLNCRNNKFRACTLCSWCDRTVEPWIDMAPYRFILRAIRRDEHKRDSKSSIVFIIQDKDIYYLLERIWHAQSIVSECNDLEQLRFVRWNINEEWSPWNCILLTEEEAKSHLRVKKLEDVYDEDFIQLILSKHVFAKCVFGNVLLLEKSIKAMEEANPVVEIPERKIESCLTFETESTSHNSSLKRNFRV